MQRGLEFDHTVKQGDPSLVARGPELCTVLANMANGVTKTTHTNWAVPAKLVVDQLKHHRIGRFCVTRSSFRSVTRMYQGCEALSVQRYRRMRMRVLEDNLVFLSRGQSNVVPSGSINSDRVFI